MIKVRPDQNIVFGCFSESIEFIKRKIHYTFHTTTKGLITFIQFFNSFIHLELFKLTKKKTIFMITKKYLPIFVHFSFEKFNEFIGKMQMGKPQLSQLFCVPWAIEVHCFIFGDTWINTLKDICALHCTLLVFLQLHVAKTTIC